MNSILSNLKDKLKFKRPNNLKVVVFSIGTAAVFWLFQALGDEYDTTLGYPVTWQFDTEEFVVVDELPKKININVGGIGWNLLRASFGFKVKPVVIDLSNPVSSKKIAGISLTNRVDDQLEEIKLNYILDDTLVLNIDKRGARSFAVYIDSAAISLAENYRIVSPILLDTDLLEIVGPLSIITAIQSDSFTLDLNREAIKSDFSRQIDFNIARPELFLFRPQSARVSFTVAEFVEAERVVILTTLNFPTDDMVALTDTICTLRFIVRKDLEATMAADSFSIVANYFMINKIDSTLLLSIEKTPPNAIDVRIDQPQVRIIYNE